MTTPKRYTVEYKLKFTVYDDSDPVDALKHITRDLTRYIIPQCWSVDYALATKLSEPMEEYEANEKLSKYPDLTSDFTINS